MKAMVLCAGHGTRLGELTKEIPKPMLPLCGQPIVSHIINNLRIHGFDELIINLHFKPEIIREYLGDGSRFNAKIKFTEELQLLGTAGGVKNAELLLRGDAPFLVHYGDILTNQDFSAMLRLHNERNALVTLLLHQRTNSNSIVSLENDGRIIGFLERPDEHVRKGVLSPWVNSGICICDPEIFDFIPSGVPCDFPRDIFPKLLSGGRLFGFPLSGYRCAIDSPERLAEAQAALVEGRCRIGGQS